MKTKMRKKTIFFSFRIKIKKNNGSNFLLDKEGSNHGQAGASQYTATLELVKRCPTNNHIIFIVSFYLISKHFLSNAVEKSN